MLGYLISPFTVLHVERAEDGKPPHLLDAHASLEEVGCQNNTRPRQVVKDLVGSGEVRTNKWCASLLWLIAVKRPGSVHILDETVKMKQYKPLKRKNSHED